MIKRFLSSSSSASNFISRTSIRPNPFSNRAKLVSRLQEVKNPGGMTFIVDSRSRTAFPQYNNLKNAIKDANLRTIKKNMEYNVKMPTKRHLMKKTKQIQKAQAAFHEKVQAAKELIKIQRGE